MVCYTLFLKIVIIFEFKKVFLSTFKILLFSRYPERVLLNQEAIVFSGII